MTAERAIQFAMFILILVGLCGLSAWASYTYLSENVILEAAAIALSWGVILLILYIGFKKLDWEWWR
jgi:TRAP-type C4-dicarboxylate transport system permease small subunit